MGCPPENSGSQGDTLAKGKSSRTIGPYREEASSVAEDELQGIERGSPLKVVSSAGVPMVRIHLPPAARWYGAGGEGDGTIVAGK
jgi:hypothetical protein